MAMNADAARGRTGGRFGLQRAPGAGHGDKADGLWPNRSDWHVEEASGRTERGSSRSSDLQWLESWPRRTSAWVLRGRPVSVVVPTYNRAGQLDRLLRSLLAVKYQPLEIIVVDNASTDGTREIVEQYPGVRYARLEENRFCSGARAVGAKLASGDAILFIDDDNVVAADLVDELVRSLDEDPENGIAGPVMYRYDKPEEVWCAGAQITRFGLLRHLHGVGSTSKPSTSRADPETVEVDYFPNCFMVRREVFEEGVDLDPEIFPHNWSEVDFCLRARRAGFRTVLAPSAVEWHDLGYRGLLTRTSVATVFDQACSRMRFRRRHRNTFPEWLVFAVAVWPTSTVMIALQLALSRQLWRGLGLYLRGTLAGLRSPIEAGQL